MSGKEPGEVAFHGYWTTKEMEFSKLEPRTKEYWAHVESEVLAAQAPELAELRKDKARLDWLEASSSIEHDWLASFHRWLSTHGGVREGIDGAMGSKV